MEGFGRDNITNREVLVINRYRSRLKEIEDQSITKRLVSRDTNSLEFYKITPKD